MPDDKPKTKIELELDAIMNRARAGEEVQASDRRRVVAWALSNGDMTQQDLADLFGVNEKTIRRDKQTLDQDRIESLPDDTDIKRIVADLIKSRDESIERIKKAQKTIPAGSANWLAYEKAAHDIHHNTVKQLSNLGWLPKNIGTITVRKSVFKAIVHSDGSVVTRPAVDSDLTAAEMIESRPLDLFDDIRDGETLEQSFERRRRERALLIEAQQIKLLPAAGETTDGTNSNSQTEGQVSG